MFWSACLLWHLHNQIQWDPIWLAWHDIHIVTLCSFTHYSYPHSPTMQLPTAKITGWYFSDSIRTSPILAEGPKHPRPSARRKEKKKKRIKNDTNLKIFGFKILYTLLVYFYTLLLYKLYKKLTHLNSFVDYI